MKRRRHSFFVLAAFVCGLCLTFSGVALAKSGGGDAGAATMMTVAGGSGTNLMATLAPSQTITTGQVEILMNSQGATPVFAEVLGGASDLLREQSFSSYLSEVIGQGIARSGVYAWAGTVLVAESRTTLPIAT